MNKILIDKKINNTLDDVIIKGNEITFLKAGYYEIEYINNGKYELNFNINTDVELFFSSYDKELEIHDHYIVNNGTLKITKFYNNDKVNEVIDIDLCSKNSKVDYNFANICKQEENYTININHKCKNTFSNINNKSVAFKNSKLKFIINSNVLKDCVKSILNQNTRIVTMGECDASISPNMYIDLDDVEARHGSIIGAFKEDQIFYLMSKGINYNDALKLLIKGYLLGSLNAHEEEKEKIEKIINMYWR